MVKKLMKLQLDQGDMNELQPRMEDLGTNKVAFIFYKNKTPFNLLQRLSFDRQHYSGIMTLVERSDRKAKDEHFTVMLFTDNVNENFCSIVKFARIKDADGKRWSDQPEQTELNLFEQS